jgi:hypothetical protein
MDICCILRATGSESVSVMKTVKTYSTRVDAEVAKITLAAAGVPAVVVGIGTELEGGTSGVQLQVEDENVQAALRVLERS